MKRFKNILYVAQSSVTQDAAMARAVSLAHNNQARLTVMDVVPGAPAGIAAPSGKPIGADLTAIMLAERRRLLDSLVAPHREQATLDIQVLHGKKFLQVIQAVLRNDHDLVIKPAENPDWIERLFGSDDMHLLRKSPCPVWLLRPEEKTNYRCIVAAIKADPDDAGGEAQALNLKILELASSLALSDFADLHVVHAWDAPGAGLVRLWAGDAGGAECEIVEGERGRHGLAVTGLLERLRERIGAGAYDYLAPRVHLPMGDPERAIPALVRTLGADLVVMGTVARTGIPGLIIGNTAEAVLYQLQSSVLAIKPPGFVSPVAQG